MPQDRGMHVRHQYHQQHLSMIQGYSNWMIVWMNILYFHLEIFVNHGQSLLGHFSCLGLLFLSFFLDLLFLLFLHDFSVWFVRFLIKFGESLHLFFGGESGGQLLDLGFLIGHIIGDPGESIITGLQNRKGPKLLVFFSDVVIHDAFVGFLCSDQDSDMLTSFMFENSHLSDPSLFPLAPEAINFGLELGNFFFLLFSSDEGHLFQIDYFPIPNDFLLNVLLLLVSRVFFLLLFRLWQFADFFRLEHMLK